MAMTAVRALAAGGPASLSRFRGSLVAAVLGDCVGGEFEGAEEVPMESVLQHLSNLDNETEGNGNRKYKLSWAYKFTQNEILAYKIVLIVVEDIPTFSLNTLLYFLPMLSCAAEELQKSEFN